MVSPEHRFVVVAKELVLGVLILVLVGMACALVYGCWQLLHENHIVQEAPPSPPLPVMFSAHRARVVLLPRQEQQAPSAPPVQDLLTLREVIDILADYNIKHQADSSMSERLFGETRGRRRTVYINDDVDLAERRDTVLHEFLHIHYGLLGNDATGDDDSEAMIREQAHQMYLQLFAPKRLEIHVEPALMPKGAY